jgi:3-oxoacyl-[acyl-carrier-protein] synthase II
MKRKVVVTGVGAVTGYGIGADALWKGLVAGRSSVRPVEWVGWDSAPVQVAAQVPEKLSGSGWRNLQMARMALREALEGSRPEGIGGLAAAIGWPGPDEEKEADPLEILAREFSLPGPREESLAACAASTQAIGEAFRLVRDGEAEWMVAGGADGRAHPGGLLGYDRLGALARGFRDSPEQACRPFGKGRTGFVVGEGAAFLVLEDKGRAEKRGAKIYAEIGGAAEGCDAFRVTDPGEDAVEAAFCIESCLQDAGLRSDEVDAVVSHGTGTPANDRVEASALRQIFGERQPWANAPKSRIGHLSMACGAVESAIVVLALREDFFPATAAEGWEGDRDCAVRMAPAPGVKGIRSVLKPSFGFGGQNACLLFRRG